MNLWTKDFIIKSAESALSTGFATFAGTLVLTTTPTWKDLAAAVTASGVKTLYNFSKALGGVQATKANK